MSKSEIVFRLLAWFETNARDLPWRLTREPYAIWVSEIMLQQTQVKTVLPYWKRWMEVMPDVRALARARPERLHKLWEGLGYYTRVRNLQKAARLILAEQGGRFPEEFEKVLALPGIGRYTAGAICSIAFNQPKPILDGNVTRVLARLHGIGGNPRDRETNTRLWGLAEELVREAARAGRGNPKAEIRRPKEGRDPRSEIRRREDRRCCSELNQSLMELGALVCGPKRPQCPVCPVARLCAARREGRVEDLPGKGRRARVTRRRFVAFVVERRGRLLVRQRPAGVVNAHLWEFPNVEVESSRENPTSLAERTLGFRPEDLEPVCTVKHSITRYRIAMEVFRVAGCPKSAASQEGRWLSLQELERLPFSSAHKRVLAALKEEANRIATCVADA